MSPATLLLLAAVATGGPEIQVGLAGVQDPGRVAAARAALQRVQPDLPDGIAVRAWTDAHGLWFSARGQPGTAAGVLGGALEALVTPAPVETSAPPPSPAVAVVLELHRVMRGAQAPVRSDLVLGASPEVPETALSELRKRLLAGLPDARRELPPRLEAKTRLLAHEGRGRCHLALGHLATQPREADRPGLALLSAVLGGGPGGRLTLRLRDELGLVAGAYARLDGPPGQSRWYTQLEGPCSKVVVALRTLREMLAELRDTPIEASELEGALRYLRGRHALAGTTASRQLTRRLSRPPPIPEAPPTPDALKALAQRYLNLRFPQLVVAGDPRAIVLLQASGQGEGPPPTAALADALHSVPGAGPVQKLDGLTPAATSP